MYCLRERLLDGLICGAYTEGALMIAARLALWFSVKADTSTPKYACAAACIPYAPRPKYTVFRYMARISSLLYAASI